MVKDKITLKNETGLHARPASELAKLAASFQSTIKLNVNGKMRLNVMEKMRKKLYQKLKKVLKIILVKNKNRQILITV